MSARTRQPARPRQGTHASSRAVLSTLLDCITLLDATPLVLWQQARLTLTQVGVLRRLRDGPQSPSELAYALAMSPASATRVLDRLERRGYVARRRRDDDRRRVEITLQPEGLSLLGELSILPGTAVDAAVRKLSPPERDDMQRSLTRLLDLAREAGLKDAR